LEGSIEGVHNEAVLLNVDGEIREVPLAMVSSARLVPEL
jgi:ribosome maturation factor RimP